MYVKITNGAVDQYPYTVGNLRRDNPNVSFPKNITSETLQSYGVYPFTIADMPSYDAKTQKVVQEEEPTLVDGVWVVGWSIESMTQDEIDEYNESEAKENRVARTMKLQDTDFYALSDVTMSAEMTAYRQALRDITSHANWPHLEDADWPTKPS
jgi:hypothetical protein